MRAKRCAGCGRCLRNVERDECSDCGKLFCVDCLVLDSTCTVLCMTCTGDSFAEMDFEYDYFSRLRPGGRQTGAEFDREESRYPDWDAPPEFSVA